MTRAGGLPQSAHCNRLSRVALAKYYVEQTTNTKPNLHWRMRFLIPTVFIRVDSELATNTKTSASRQNLSIQLSSWDVTSVPGLRRRENNNNNTEKRKQSIRRPFFCTVKVNFGNNRECVTCQRAPGHLWAEHTWFWARTLGQGSRHPGSHPCAEHEPVGSQSAGRRSSTHKKQVSQYPQNHIWCTHHITYCVF